MLDIETLERLLALAIFFIYMAYGLISMGPAILRGLLVLLRVRK
jgi:hypothetical protein